MTFPDAIMPIAQSGDPIAISTTRRFNLVIIGGCGCILTYRNRKKWSPFCGQYFSMQYVFNENLTGVGTKDLINNKSSLVQV